MKALIALVALALVVWYLISVNSTHEPMPGLPAPATQSGSRPLSPDVYSSLTDKVMNIFVKEAAAEPEIQPVKDESRMAVRSLGKDDAPVTAYVFTSLTCFHCADYHNHVWPVLIKRYVDEGKVRLIYVDFPLNSESMSGAVLAQCLPPAQYLPFINQLFAERDNWVGKAKSQDILVTYAQKKGISLQKARACLADTALQKSVHQAQEFYMQTYQVEATPTTVILSDKGQKKVVGADLKEITDAINSLL